jgi:hypothetical protein
MMMEDDFLICDRAFQELFRFIDVANSRSQRWMGVRASYGLNGIVLNIHDAVSLHSLPVSLLAAKVHSRSHVAVI